MILTLLSMVISLGPFLALGAAVAVIAVRHQRLLLALFMFLTALENTRDFAPMLGMSMSGISVYPEDIVMLVCVGAALVRVGQWRIGGASLTALIILLTFVGVGAITWISAYGLQQGVNSWRSEMLIVALLLYTTTRPRAWSWNDLRVIIVAPAIAVAAASLIGILMFGFGSNSSAVEVNGVLEAGRPVWAAGSLMMIVGLWVTAFSVGKWRTTRVLVVLFLGIMVLLNQNRSVWVAAILGAAVWWLAPRIRPHGTFNGLGGLTRTILVLLIATATALAAASSATLGQSAHDDRTWLWRVALWADSMSIPRSGLEWAVGSVLGTTSASAVGRFPAHSMYVNAIEKTGFIGLAALLLLIIAVAKVRFPPSIDPLSLVVCIMFLGYGVAYQLPPWAWMLVGIFLASSSAATSIEQSGSGRNATPDTSRDLPRARARANAASTGHGVDSG